MKLKLLRSLMLIAVLLTGSHAFAYDFEVDGIYYDIISTDDMTVRVTYKDTNYNSYTGDVVIPSTVTSGDITYIVAEIGSGAFYDCTGLTSVEIPSSVTSIGQIAFNYAFYNIISLLSIDVDSENENYSSLNGVLFNKNKTELLCYPSGKTESSYSIPNNVTSIGEHAFNDCNSLESITIPNSVTSIGLSAFSNCI